MAYQMKLNLQKIKDSYMEVQINAPLFFCHNLCWRFSVQFQICCLIGLAEFLLFFVMTVCFNICSNSSTSMFSIQWLKFCVLPCDREVFLLILSWFLMAASALFLKRSGTKEKRSRASHYYADIAQRFKSWVVWGGAEESLYVGCRIFYTKNKRS